MTDLIIVCGASLLLQEGSTCEFELTMQWPLQLNLESVLNIRKILLFRFIKNLIYLVRIID
jgi:hypothetical protein